MGRVMVFIDGSNLYHGLRESFGRTDIDLGKVSIKLAGGRDLLRTYYYGCMVPQDLDQPRYQRQQRFFAALRSLPDFEVRLGRLQRVPPDGACVEKGVDVQIAVDMVSRAFKNQFDEAVLVSGDADYARVVQEVKDSGKRVEVAYPGKCFHLRTVADRFTALDEFFLKDCWIRRAPTVENTLQRTTRG